MSVNIKKTTFYLFGIRLISSVISFFSLPIMVEYFGISTERDIWLLVSLFISSLSNAAFGPINDTFRARFVFIRETRGQDEALRAIQPLLTFFVITGIFLGLISFLFAEKIRIFLAPSLSTAYDYKIFFYVFVLMLPNFIINQLITTFIAILNTYEVFYIPEIAGCFTGLLNILCIYLFASTMGIFSLIISMYISTILLFSILVLFIKGKKIKIFNISNGFKLRNIKDFFVISFPFYIPYFLGQLNGIIEKKLMNIIGTGVVSTVDYAMKFPQIVQGVLIGILTSVLTPSLTSSFATNNLNGFSDSMKQSVQLISGIVIIFVSFLWGSTQPLCTYFFFRGDIDEQTVNTIINLVRLYACALICVAFYYLFGLALLSQQQGKYYAGLGAYAQLFMIAFNIIFYKKFSIYTFVFSFSIAHISAAIIMSKLLLLEKKYLLFGYFMKSLLVTLCISMILFLFNRNLQLNSVFFQLVLNGLLLCLFGIIGLRLIGINVLKTLKLSLF